mgnify:CR=1 FL=1
MSTKPDYGNWVSQKLIFYSLAMAIVFGLIYATLIFIGPGLQFLKTTLLVFGILSLGSLIYFTYARYAFSFHGGKVQETILGFLLSRIEWDGKGTVLDIGCGSGPLVVKLAKKFPESRIHGVDYWGGVWEYSQKKCEDNAAAEGVGGQITFLRASASKLPFPDESFDLVVSNLVFHEVSDVSDKQEVLKEAFRVLKKGGRFVFQDLFLIKRIYGDIDDLLKAMKSWGISEVQFENTSQSNQIPPALKLPFMVGTLAIIRGKK